MSSTRALTSVIRSSGLFLPFAAASTSYYLSDNIKKNGCSSSGGGTHCESAMIVGGGDNQSQTKAAAAARSSSSSLLGENNHKRLTTSSQEAEDEEQRFSNTLAKYRSYLMHYRDAWDYNKASSRVPTASWPQNVPPPKELPALTLDMTFCGRSPNYRDDTRYCDSVRFRVASALLLSSSSSGGDQDAEAKGLHLMKDLAERGHADGMCMYGKCLNEGRCDLEPNPQQAVVWWRRCAELHQHTEAMYELGVAFYTGEGVAEDETQAVTFFRAAADDGHAAASYMYGTCLLEGTGVELDRARALDRLVQAADCGHRGARSRVIALLEQKEGDQFGMFTDASRQSISPTAVIDDGNRHYTQQQALLAERRFTIGGSPPAVIARRRTIVEESRNV